MKASYEYFGLNKSYPQCVDRLLVTDIEMDIIFAEDAEVASFHPMTFDLQFQIDVFNLTVEKLSQLEQFAIGLQKPWHDFQSIPPNVALRMGIVQGMIEMFKLYRQRKIDMIQKLFYAMVNGLRFSDVERVETDDEPSVPEDDGRGTFLGAFTTDYSRALMGQ